MEKDESSRTMLTRAEVETMLEIKNRRLKSLERTKDHLLRTKPTAGSMSLQLWFRLRSRNEDMIKAIETEIYVLNRDLVVLSEEK